MIPHEVRHPKLLDAGLARAEDLSGAAEPQIGLGHLESVGGPFQDFQPTPGTIVLRADGEPVAGAARSAPHLHVRAARHGPVMARVMPGYWMLTNRVDPSGEKTAPANSEFP